MTNGDLINKLSLLNKDSVVICADTEGGWDNIENIENNGSTIKIIFGGGSPFSSDKY